MTPYFASWQEFFAMGKYGFYVWLSYAASLLVLGWILLLPLLQHRRLQRQARRQQRRQAGQAEAGMDSVNKMGDKHESSTP